KATLENQVQQIVQVFKSIKEKDSSSVLFLTADKENNNIESVYSILTKNDFIVPKINYVSEPRKIYFYNSSSTTGNPSILMTRSLRNCDKQLKNADLINKGIKIYNRFFREPLSYRREYLVNEPKPNLKDILINYAVSNKKVYNGCTIDKIVNLADEFTKEFEKSKFDLYMDDASEYIKSAASSDLAVIIPNSGGAEKESIFDDTYALFEWWTNRELYGIKKQDKCSQALNTFKQKIFPDNNKNSAPLNDFKGITWQEKYYSLIKKLSEDLIEYWASKKIALKKKLLRTIDEFKELINHFSDSSATFNEDNHRLLVFHLSCLGNVFIKKSYSVQKTAINDKNNLFIIRKRFRDNMALFYKYSKILGNIYKDIGPSVNNYNKDYIILSIEGYKNILNERLSFISEMNSCISELIDDIERHQKFHNGIKTQYDHDYYSIKSRVENITGILNKIDDNTELKVLFEIETQKTIPLFKHLMRVGAGIYTQIKAFENNIRSKNKISEETPYEISLALGSLIHVVSIIEKGNNWMLIDVQDEVSYYTTQILNHYTPEKIIPICDDLFKSHLKKAKNIF
ncbi:hypothetical protein BB560_007155, partial [Smittium megazygosporum]